MGQRGALADKARPGCGPWHSVVSARHAKDVSHCPGGLLGSHRFAHLCSQMTSACSEGHGQSALLHGTLALAGSLGTQHEDLIWCPSGCCLLSLPAPLQTLLVLPSKERASGAWRPRARRHQNERTPLFSMPAAALCASSGLLLRFVHVQVNVACRRRVQAPQPERRKHATCGILRPTLARVSGCSQHFGSWAFALLGAPATQLPAQQPVHNGQPLLGCLSLAVRAHS